MKKNKYTFYTKRSSPSNKKTFIISSILITIITLCLFTFYNYKKTFNDFYYNFDNNNYCKANNVLLINSKYNPLKSLFLKRNLTNYFNNLISNLSKKINNGTITNTEAINTLSEINKYDFLDIDTSSLLTSLNYKDPYKDGLSLFNSKKYVEAYNILLTVPSNSLHYSNAINYINNCKEKIKNDTLNEANKLCKKDYYTKALNLIDNVKNIIGNDKEIKKKISEITKDKNNYIASLDGDSLETTSIIVKNITKDNINSLSLESKTNYLVTVDLKSQNTYIYEGSKNKWNLLKTFKCSTGIKNKETPEGIFSIKEKGEWFFSQKYNQGGKYWVQFSGNYLFHSIPFDKDKKTIVDYTLGTPSSHGCIRLSVDDSKWLYDNIPKNTKVIIK